MASYAETVRFVGIIERGLARFEALQKLYLVGILAELEATVKVMAIAGQAADVKRVLKKTSWQERALELGKMGMLEPMAVVLIDRLKKANDKISDWQKVKALHLKGLNVSAGHGFDVRVISISNKGMMVSIKHASQKHPVTRHLQKKGNVYTGKAPFGASHFIEYHVNIVGDLKSRENESPAMISFEKPVLNKAA